jgi:hypothetical protein
MSAQTTISRPTGSQLRVGPVGIALVAIAGMLGGLGLAAGASLLPITQPAIEAEAPVFDAVKFRADEKSLSGGTPDFDAVKFRAEEKDISLPVFDPVRFRAEEKSLR